MQLKRRILLLQRSEQVFVSLDAEIRMQPSLHQNTGAAQRDCLVNLLADFVERAHVSVGRARPSIERTEGADHVANVRVVNVSIDDVGDDVVGMLALANLVRRRADFRDVVRLEQRRAIVGSQSDTGERPFENRLNIRGRHVCSLFSWRAIVQPARGSTRSSQNSSFGVGPGLSLVTYGTILNAGRPVVSRIFSWPSGNVGVIRRFQTTNQVTRQITFDENTGVRKFGPASSFSTQVPRL